MSLDAAAAPETSPEPERRCCGALGGEEYAQVPNTVLRADISAQAVRLYAVLARHAGSDGTCYPGRAHLATALGVGKEAVDRAARELEGAGLLTTERRRPDKTGRTWTSNLYRLPRGGSRTNTTTPTDTASPITTTSPTDATTGVVASVEPPGRTDTTGVVVPTRPEREQGTRAKNEGGHASTEQPRCATHKGWETAPSCGGCKEARERRDLELHQAEAAEKAARASSLDAQRAELRLLPRGDEKVEEGIRLYGRNDPRSVRFARDELADLVGVPGDLEGAIGR